MEHNETRLMVLARIPDLSAAGSEGGSSPASSAESGRLISQVASFRLLAATALLLLLGAIIPFSLCQKASTPAPTAATSSPSPASDHSPPPAPVALWPSRVLDAPAPQPDVAVVPPRAADDTPQMSAWPNPAHLTSYQTEAGVKGPQSSSNQPTAVRPPLFQADAGTGQPGPAPGSAQLKGLLPKPVIQNTHVRTRSSVH
jgi:hypothetical protein